MNKLSIGACSNFMFASASDKLARLVFIQRIVRPSSVAFSHTHGWIDKALKSSIICFKNVCYAPIKLKRETCLHHYLFGQLYFDSMNWAASVIGKSTPKANTQMTIKIHLSIIYWCLYIAKTRGIIFFLMKFPSSKRLDLYI